MPSQASQEDLEFGETREQLAAELFVEMMWPGWTPSKRGKHSHIDFAAVEDGLLKGLLEVKVRRCGSDEYPTTAVNLMKHVSARMLRRSVKARTACLVVFTDRAGYFWLDEKPDAVENIARMDRDGVGYPHAMYSVERITWLEGFVEALNTRLEAVRGQEEHSPPAEIE